MKDPSPQPTAAAENKDVNPADWVDLYADYLYRFALMRIADKEIAEDLVQETFSATLASLKNNRFQGRASLKTWLTSILKHKLMDHLRGKYKHRALPLDKIDSNQVEESFDARGNWQVKPGNWGADPPDLYEQKELAAILMACLETLQERQADAIRLRELDGKETEEICKILLISSTNYWVIMHRARLALRRCVERQWLNEA